MLDAEGPLTPMAGCTDLYVALNFGELKGTGFLNLWPLDQLRRITVARRRAVDRRALHLHGPDAIAPRPEACADARGRRARDRGRADPEPRHDRRQHRERLAGGRHAPSACRGRRDGRGREHSRTAPGPVHAVLHGVSAYGPERGRADCRRRGSGDRGPAVVSKSGHARGTGHLEGRHGRRGRRAATGAADRRRQRRADGRAAAPRPRPRSPRARRLPTRSGFSPTRSLPSTMCGPPPSTDGACRRTCSRVSGVSRAGRC